MSLQAMQFAMEKHTGQLRRYTNEPYWGHLAEVAGIVAMTQNVLPLQLQVAWLHDTIEDTATTFGELYDTFGPVVAGCVQWLTDVEEERRKTRKASANARLSQSPEWIQTIKLADGLSNLQSIVQHDRKFAKVYVQEWMDLLNVMDKGDAILYAMLLRKVKQAEVILNCEALN